MVLYSKALYQHGCWMSSTTTVLDDIIYIMHKRREVFVLRFFQRLKDMREDHDLTQRDIANLLKMHYQQYARYENGEYQMPIEYYKTLAHFYGVSIDYLSGVISIPKTLDGSPYTISKNITITQTGNGKINIKQ